MGLDMYLYANDKNANEDKRCAQIHYWRKHNALHAFMEGIWRREKPEEADKTEFNCIQLDMTPELLDEVESAIRQGKMRPASGFFFGSTDYDPKEYMNDDLEAIAEARTALANGQRVYYWSWW